MNVREGTRKKQPEVKELTTAHYSCRTAQAVIFSYCGVSNSSRFYLTHSINNAYHRYLSITHNLSQQKNMDLPQYVKGVTSILSMLVRFLLISTQILPTQRHIRELFCR